MADVKVDEILTLKGLAEYLRCHKTTLYRLIKTGEIPYFRVGSDYRFHTSSIREWIEKRGASKTSRPRPSAPAPRRSTVVRKGRGKR